MVRLYAALTDRLLVAAETGDGFRVAERLVDREPQAVTASPAEPERVFCGTFDAGVWRSTDAGESWERVGEGTILESVTSLAVNPCDPDEIWVGTEPSAVYWSTDGGDEWESRPGLTDLPSASGWSFPPRPATHHVRWIEVDPANPAHLYVGIEAGALVQTHDAGETWEDRRPSSRRDNHSLTAHPDAPGRAYAAAGDGYAETADGGETWRYPQEGLDHRYCWSVAVDPGDPETVVVSSAAGPRSAHNARTAESYVYRRTGDEPWERSMAGLPDPEGLLRPVLAPGDEPGELWAATNHGVYRSANAGEEWNRADVSWRDEYRDAAPQGLAVVP